MEELYEFDEALLEEMNIAALEKAVIKAVLAGSNDPKAMGQLTRLVKLGKYDMNRLRKR